MTDSSGIRRIDPALGCPGAKFVQTSRSYSVERRAEIEAHAAETFGSTDVLKDQWGDFYHARYERQHPELWEDAYRNIWECQQEEQAEAQRLAWEAQQAEEATEAQRRNERRENILKAARLTALASAEADLITKCSLLEQLEALRETLPGEITRETIDREAVETYLPYSSLASHGGGETSPDESCGFQSGAAETCANAQRFQCVKLISIGAPRCFTQEERETFVEQDIIGIIPSDIPDTALPSNVVNIADFRK